MQGSVVSKVSAATTLILAAFTIMMIDGGFVHEIVGGNLWVACSREAIASS